MKFRIGLLLAAISLIAAVPFVQAASAVPSSPSAGYATYSVQVTVNGTSRAATVTETVSPSAASGQSILQLEVQGTESNFTYSHVVNSSLTLFPYLPALTNNSYTYSGKSGTFTATLSKGGTSQVTFNGASYTLQDYSFSATYSGANGTRSLSGTIAAFPSDLVYSASASSDGAQASAELTATSLPLNASSASPATQATSAGIGISLVVGAVAVSLGVKFRHKPQAEGPKPEYWVD